MIWLAFSKPDSHIRKGQAKAKKHETGNKDTTNGTSNNKPPLIAGGSAIVGITLRPETLRPQLSLSLPLQLLQAVIQHKRL